MRGFIHTKVEFASDVQSDVFRIHRLVWAGPATVCGLILASLALWRGRIAVVDGVLEVHGPAIAWMLSHVVPLEGGAASITFGHVVIGRDAASLACSRAHERVHVRQYERWGPAFIPAYVIAGLSAVVRGGHPYFANPFEIEAFRAEGRQVQQPPRRATSPALDRFRRRRHQTALRSIPDSTTVRREPAHSLRSDDVA